MIWGGDRIAPFKGIETDLEKIGESWEISGHPDHETAVAEGPLAGKTVNELVALFKEPLQYCSPEHQRQRIQAIPDTHGMLHTTVPGKGLLELFATGATDKPVRVKDITERRLQIRPKSFGNVIQGVKRYLHLRQWPTLFYFAETSLIKSSYS